MSKRTCCRLEVGTESSLDRSKSVKSFLMQYFAQSGNNDVVVCLGSGCMSWHVCSCCPNPCLLTARHQRNGLKPFGLARLHKAGTWSASCLRNAAS